MFKKRLALFLTSILVFMVSVPVMAVDTPLVFPDVTTDNANYTAIKELTSLGIIKGYEDGTFKPFQTITRAEFTKMLIEMKDKETVGFFADDVKTGFADVDVPSHWASKYIKVAYDQKIIIGFEDGTFRPDAPVKVEEAIKMLVCYLGYGDMAKEKATQANVQIWPFGYMDMGYELYVNKLVSLKVGDDATRASVAQMIYNIKDTKKLGALNIIIPITSGGSSGGGGGGGGTITNTIKVFGTVVGVKGLYIDSAAEAKFGTIGKNDLVLKLSTQYEGEDYILLKTSGTDRSNLCGYKCEVYFDINDMLEKVITIINQISTSNTVTYVNSDDILQSQCTAREFHYLNADDKNSRLTLPINLNDLNVIYNGRLIKQRTPLDTSPEPVGVLLSDLLPSLGDITFIDNGSGTFSLIRVNSYETFLVDTKNSTSKYVTDMYVKDSNGVAKKEYLDVDTLTSLEMVNCSTNAVMSFGSLSKWDTLSIATSKDGNYKKVLVYPGYNALSGRIIEADPNGLYIKINNTEYEFTDYFNTNVRPTMESFEVGTDIKVYLDHTSKISSVYVTEATFSYGYLTNANLEGMTTTELQFQIITSNGSSASQTIYIADNNIKFNGVKPVTFANIMEALKAGAALINADKPAGLTSNATYAQPVRFSMTNGKITAMETLSSFNGVATNNPNMFIEDAYRFTTSSQPVRYWQNEGQLGNMTLYTDTVIFYVPNDRSDASQYFIGTRLQLSNKLIANNMYNAESYIYKKSDGTNTRGAVVIYNEDLDSAVSISSPVIVIGSIDSVLDNNGGTNMGITAANTGASYILKNGIAQAIMIDKNGNRIKNDIRTISPGDVIRFGFAPDGNILHLEMLLDASDPILSMKLFALNKYNRLLTFADDNELREQDPVYYIRCGVITAVDNVMFENYTIKMSPTTSSIISLGDQKDYARAFMYNFNVNFKIDTVIFKNIPPEIGDIVFIHMGADSQIVTMYLIRLTPEGQVSVLNAVTSSAPTPSPSPTPDPTPSPTPEPTPTPTPEP